MASKHTASVSNPKNTTSAPRMKTIRLPVGTAVTTPSVKAAPFKGGTFPSIGKVTNLPVPTGSWAAGSAPVRAVKDLPDPNLAAIAEERRARAHLQALTRECQRTIELDDSEDHEFEAWEERLHDWEACGRD